MPKVQVLSKEISELIAAGEVIERPSSVIKELIENSIDSGATSITVEIKNGGISYIRVTDNGCGIDKDDVPTAFLRHATSKISAADDLSDIHTLGFRGEALASICAVAKVEVLTKPKGSEYGTHYIIEGSEEKLIEQTGCPDGTTVIIRDIFYNVPARLKFLKKDVAEGNAVADITSKIAVSHPEISFKFIRNNRQDFITPGDGELYSSIYTVMGRDFAETLLPVNYELNGVKITGFTVKPIHGRPKRSFQYFFVNGRYVRTYVCTSALEEAYRNSIMEGKFPACVLRVEIAPSMLDVNVHPAKVEVRFTDDRIVHDGIYFSVKNSILADSKPIEMRFEQCAPDYTRPLPESYNIGTQMTFPAQPAAYAPAQPRVSEHVTEIVPAVTEGPVYGTAVKPDPEYNGIFTPKKTYNGVFPAEDTSEKYQTEVPYNVQSDGDTVPFEKLKSEIPQETDFKYISPKSFAAKAQEPAENPPEKEIFFRIIGEAFKNYIVTEIDDSVIFVDKHAAHERILFEKLKSGKQPLQCQMLLFPAEVMLPNADFDALMKNRDTAETLGFSLEGRNGMTVLVKGIPGILDGCDVSDLVIELAHNFSVNRNDPMPEILDNMYHTFACKAAIKAGDRSSPKELSEIVKTLLEDETIRYCPHGRPVMFSLSKYELEKQFKRIV